MGSTKYEVAWCEDYIVVIGSGHGGRSRSDDGRT